MKKTTSAIAILLILIGISACNTPITSQQSNQPKKTTLPEWWQHWKEKTEASRQVIQEMTHNTNLRDVDTAYKKFIATFSDDVKIYGLSQKVENKHHVEEHYHPVFYVLKLVLVNDELIAAGDYVMERYHAWRKFAEDQGPLEFDGCQFKPESGAFSIRGYTLFKIEHGKIAVRYSNHDHGYRFAQTCGDRTKGDNIKASLSGGFPDDEKMYSLSQQYIKNLSLINQSHEKRLIAAVSLFTKDAMVHGVKEGAGTTEDVKTYLSRLWQSFPDLKYHAIGMSTAWGRVAIRYQATGSHRQQWFDRPADHQSARLTGEIILQFNQSGKIIEAWVYDHLEELDKVYN